MKPKRKQLKMRLPIQLTFNLLQIVQKKPMQAIKIKMTLLHHNQRHLMRIQIEKRRSSNRYQMNCSGQSNKLQLPRLMKAYIWIKKLLTKPKQMMQNRKKIICKNQRIWHKSQLIMLKRNSIIISKSLIMMKPYMNLQLKDFRQIKMVLQSSMRLSFLRTVPLRLLLLHAKVKLITQLNQLLKHKKNLKKVSQKQLKKLQLNINYLQPIHLMELQIPSAIFF